MALNDIAQVTLRTADPLPVEAYRPGGAVGSLLIIDPADGTTLAAGMVGDRRAALHPDRPAPETTDNEEDWHEMHRLPPHHPADHASWSDVRARPAPAATTRSAPSNAHTPGP